MKTNKKFTNLEISDFSGGINTEKVATDIEDNQCVDIQNLFFTKSNDLEFRYGVEKINATPSAFDGRITSIFPSTFGSIITPIVLITTASKVYRESEDDTYIDLTGSVKLPNDVFWSFRQFDDLVIGCNGAINNSGTSNPICWDGKTTVIRQLLDGTDNAPSAKFCEVYNNRLWLVSSQSPNLIYYSKLGDPEDFTENGGSIEINKDDGDYITGLYAHKGFLFIFKRRKIYRLIPGTPNTDPDQWSIEVFTSNVGCVSNWTIQAILDDLVFLSDNGIISLQAAETTGQFTSVILSRNVPKLITNISSINDYNKFASVVNQENAEYWVSVPSETSGLDNGIVFVLDYKRINDGLIRWTSFNGLTIGSAYASVLKQGKFVIYIGHKNGNLYKYGKSTIKSDDGTLITNKIITKEYNFNSKINRKEIESYGLNILNKTKGTTAFSIAVSYSFDNSTSLVNSETITYTETLAGSVWDEVTPAIGTWASLTNSRINFTRKVCPNFGRRFNTIQFTITSSTINQSGVIQNLALFLSMITARSISNA